MKFAVDRMLGKLAKELRMLGYDTYYYRGEKSYPLIKLAREEGRMILTRNTKLLPKRPEDRIIRIIEDDPWLQLKELLRQHLISPEGEGLFSRCLRCNTPLGEIRKEEVEGMVPDYIFHQKREFSQCPRCQRIYWQGSHLDHMQRKIEELAQST